jgi:signal transduction histidine kinase
MNMIPKLVRTRYESSVAKLASLKDAALNTDLLLQRLVDACASNLAVLDESGKILYASRAWRLSEEQAGLSADGDELNDIERFTKKSITLIPPTNALADDIQRLLDNRQREFHKECSHTGSQGERWFMVHAARLNLPESNGFRVLITREDITRRRTAEEELRNLGGRLISAQEEERSRIARELHDDLNQRMAILAIELDSLQRQVPTAQSDLIGSLEHLSVKAREISSDIHRLSYRLHPSKLDHLDLAAAVHGLCKEMSQQRDFEIKFEQSGFPAATPREIVLCVFRIAQESLRNIVRHSGAREAHVEIKRTSQAIHLRVSDDGCGFDVNGPGKGHGLGFISMRERLRLVGGDISIRSRPSGGTHIDVLIPLRDVKSD